MADDTRVIVFVGRGIFGVCGAIECQKRLALSTGQGRRVKVISIGTAFEDEASSYDISKITRGDYGSDELYTRLHWIALDKWRAKEQEWHMAGKDDSYFHWTGVSLLSKSRHPCPIDSYESTSFSTLQRLNPKFASKDCTVFRSEDEVKAKVNPVLHQFSSGYHNANAGWIESGLVLRKLVEEARDLGVILVDQACTSVANNGVKLEDGTFVAAEDIIVCCGAWTPFILPETRNLLKPCAQPVFLFEPRSTSVAQPWFGHTEGGKMSPLTLDIAETGFYCFPFHKRNGLLKFGHHGEGHPVDRPMTALNLRDLESTVRVKEELRFLAFLDSVVPSFSKDWKVKQFRLCQYCDSIDSHFLVDKVRPNVICAGGGSGHGFKFGMVIGELIVDCIEGKRNKNPTLAEAVDRFRMRSVNASAMKFEKARNHVKMDEGVVSRL